MPAPYRGDYITQVDKTQQLYSDFLTGFDIHPVTKSLAITKDEASVRQSIKNLVLTNVGERPFQPTVGSNVYKSMFEPNDVTTAAQIAENIRNTIRSNEPRAQLLKVDVYATSNDDELKVDILFSMINSYEPISLNFILRRVR